MLTAEQQKLVEEYHFEIYAFLSKYSLPAEEYYDLAALGLCRAAQSHDPEKGKNCTFFSYAWLFMRGEIGTELRKKRSRIKAISIETTERAEDGTAYLRDVIADPEQAEQTQDIETLEIIAKLEPIEQRAVWLVVYKMSLSESAKIMNVSPDMFCRIRETAFIKLRTYIKTGEMKPLNAVQFAQISADADRACLAEQRKERATAKINTSTASGIYYLNHREELMAVSRDYYYAHREKMLAQSRAWKADHKEQVRENRRTYEAKQRTAKARESEAVLCTA